MLIGCCAFFERLISAAKSRLVERVEAGCTGSFQTVSGSARVPNARIPHQCQGLMATTAGPLPLTTCSLVVATALPAAQLID